MEQAKRNHLTRSARKGVLNMSSRGKAEGASPRPAGASVWKLGDARARFSEVVRLAEQGIPQRVSVRGREAVVILSAQAYARLAPTASGGLGALFGKGPFARLDDFGEVLVRERAPDRERVTFEP
jgi:prevent-host-death family protein